MISKTLTIQGVPAWGVDALIDLLQQHATTHSVDITDAEAHVEVKLVGHASDIQMLRAELERLGAASLVKDG